MCGAVGERVQEIYRCYFSFEGEPDRSQGDLTLVFESGRTVRLTDTPHGYDLRITGERWVDPFAGPLDQENQQSIEECGRWQEVCVSAEPDWLPFVGKRVSAAGRLIYRDHDEPCGASLRFEGGLSLFVYNLSDEVKVELSEAPSWLEERRL